MEAIQEENENEKLEMSPEENKEKTSFYIRFKTFVFRYLLIISLTIFVIFGIVCPIPGHTLDHQISKYVCIVYIFLCSGLYLRTKEMKEALMAYKAVIWGVISILGITSIIGGQLTKLLIPDANLNVSLHNTSSMDTQSEDDPLGPVELRYGLIVYSIMPCTIASGVVLVNQLKGHVALAVLLTVTTNVASVVTIPLYTKWMLETDSKVSFDIPSLLLKLVLSVLLPIIVGKCFSFITKFRQWYERPNKKLMLKAMSSLCITFIVWFKVSTASLNGSIKSLDVISVLFVIGWGLMIHVLFMIINGFASWVLRLEIECLKCLVILASQKTMGLAVTVIVLLPSDLGDIGLMAMALIIIHISVLLFDSLVVGIWLYWEQKKTTSVSNPLMEP